MAPIVIEMDKIRDLFSGLGQFCWHLGKEFLGDQSIAYYIPASERHLFPGKELISLKKIHRKIRFLAPKAKVWHAIHQDSPFLPRNRDAKIVLTIHDLNYIYEHDDPKLQKKYLKELQKKIDRASGLTFISQFTQQEVARYLRIDHRPQAVIYNGICFDPHIIPAPPKRMPAGKFFFSIGTVLPKKNFHVLVEMMKYLPDYHFVLAGSRFHSYAREIEELAKKFGVVDRFILLGTISEAEKRWLHQNCAAFVFPSLFEGFGLPVAEAMSFGKPLFLSDKTSLPEVGGDDAFYFPSFEADSMAKTIQAGLAQFDDDRQARLIERSELFNWTTAAKDYRHFYRQLLG